MVWDQGVYEDITGNATAAYHKGKLHIVMQGKKLKGEWILLKDRRDQDEGNRWLLIKAGETLKLSAKADDTSVISGRSMAKIAKDNDAQWHSTTPEEKHRKKPPSSHRVVKPAFVEPMQCKPVDELPEGEEWSYEIKLDGYRCMVVKKDGKAQLISRNQKPLNKRFPHLATALALLPGDFTMDEKGRPSFQILQDSSGPSDSVVFYGFDLLNGDGEDLSALPLEQRRERLASLLEAAAEPLRLSPLLKASAREVLEAVCKLGLEGVVGKHLGSVYEPGERTGAWIKHRTDRQQEFVIGGYVPGAHGFDALLIGVYEGKKLMYAAKLKNGFVPRTKADILPQLKKHAVNSCPFANLPEKKGSRWGEPLTAEKMQECQWINPCLFAWPHSLSGQSPASFATVPLWR